MPLLMSVSVFPKSQRQRSEIATLFTLYNRRGGKDSLKRKGDYSDTYARSCAFPIINGKELRTPADGRWV